MACKSMKVSFRRFENACSRAKTCVILTALNYIIHMHVTVDDVNFCDGLECVGLYVKCKSHASKACELSD